MTTEINDGGSAFPQLEPRDPTLSLCSPGLSLRDWFAGQVISEWCGKSINGRQEEPVQDVARYAYHIADAMLAARVAK